MQQDLLSKAQLAAKVKEKHPEYADVDDDELVDRVVKKYPSYKSTLQPETGGMDPGFEGHVNDILSSLKTRGLNARLSQGYRTPKQQDDFYAQGRTKPGPIITYATSKTGKHPRGIAADIDLLDANGNPLPSSAKEWAALGEEASKRGLTWGGGWKKLKDLRHVEANGPVGMTAQTPATPKLPTKVPAQVRLPDDPTIDLGQRSTYTPGGTGQVRPRRTYNTTLTPEQEQEFAAWKQKQAPSDSGEDYDLRGAFKAGVVPDPKSGHWPDQFKKPNHPTFSNESQYATGADAAKAGRWKGQKFVRPTTPQKHVEQIAATAPPPIKLGQGSSQTQPDPQRQQQRSQPPNEIVSAIKNPEQLAADIRWHYGIGPNTFAGLSRAEQRRVALGAIRAAALDQQKKSRGEQPEISHPYQAQMREKAGVKFNVKSDAALPDGPGDGLDQFKTAAQRLGIPEGIEYAPGYNPESKNVEITPRKGPPKIRQISEAQMQPFLDEDAAESEIAQGQADVSNPRVPFGARTVGQQWPRVVAKAQRAIAGLADYAEMLPHPGRSKELTSENVTRRISDYLKNRARINEAIGTYEAPQDKTLAKKIARVSAQTGYDLGPLLAASASTGIPFPIVMAGEAALDNSDRPKSEIAVAVAKAYALGRAYEWLPGKLGKLAERVPVVGQLAKSYPRTAGSAIGATVFGGAGGGQAAYHGAVRDDIIAAAVGQAIPGAVLPALHGRGKSAEATEDFDVPITTIDAPKLIKRVRHSNPNIDGGEIIGTTKSGDLKVENNDGGISIVKHPRKSGNREAAIVTEKTERRGPQRIQESDWLEMSPEERAGVRSQLEAEMGPATHDNGKPIAAKSPKEVIEATGLQYVGEQEMPKGKPPGQMFNAPDGSTLMILGEVTPEAIAAKLAAHQAKFTKSVVENNASGESAASTEAISRVQSEKTNGRSRVIMDTRSGKATPITGVDAVDRKPGPFEVIIQDGVGPGGVPAVLDAGDKVTSDTRRSALELYRTRQQTAPNALTLKPRLPESDVKPVQPKAPAPVSKAVDTVLDSKVVGGAKDRVAEIDQELKKLQAQYEKKSTGGQRGSMVPPSIKGDALRSISNRMDKLEAERAALQKPAKVPTAKVIKDFTDQAEQIVTREPNVLVAKRVGDFYEFFGDTNAKRAGKTFDVTVTKRRGQFGDESGEISMAGVPHHSIARYLQAAKEKGVEVRFASGDEPPEVRVEQPKDRTAPEFVNSKKWYHGTSATDLKAEDLDPFFGDHQALMGHGIYLTDNPGIAKGYAGNRARKSGESTVYEAEVKVDKVLDLEQPATPEVRAIFEKHSKGSEDFNENFTEAAKNQKATTEDLLQALRKDVEEYSHDAMVPTSDFIELFQDLNSDLRQAGYDALTHTGGRRTGNAPHQVLILLDPHDSYSQVGRKGQVTSFKPAEQPQSEVKPSRQVPPEPGELVKQTLGPTKKPQPEQTLPKDEASMGSLDTPVVEGEKFRHKGQTYTATKVWPDGRVYASFGAGSFKRSVSFQNPEPTKPAAPTTVENTSRGEIAGVPFERQTPRKDTLARKMQIDDPSIQKDLERKAAKLDDEVKTLRKSVNRSKYGSPNYKTKSGELHELQPKLETANKELGAHKQLVRRAMLEDRAEGDSEVHAIAARMAMGGFDTKQYRLMDERMKDIARAEANKQGVPKEVIDRVVDEAVSVIRDNPLSPIFDDFTGVINTRKEKYQQEERSKVRAEHHRELEKLQELSITEQTEHGGKAGPDVDLNELPKLLEKAKKLNQERVDLRQATIDKFQKTYTMSADDGPTMVETKPDRNGFVESQRKFIAKSIKEALDSIPDDMRWKSHEALPAPVTIVVRGATAKPEKGETQVRRAGDTTYKFVEEKQLLRFHKKVLGQYPKGYGDLVSGMLGKFPPGWEKREAEEAAAEKKPEKYKPEVGHEVFARTEDGEYKRGKVTSTKASGSIVEFADGTSDNFKNKSLANVESIRRGFEEEVSKIENIAKLRAIVKRGGKFATDRIYTGNINKAGGNRTNYRKFKEDYRDPIALDVAKTELAKRRGETGAVSVDLLTLGIRPFVKEVAEKTKEAVVGAREVSDGLKRLLAPAVRTDASKATANIVRANAAELAREGDIADRTLKAARRFFGGKQPSFSLDFIDRIEQGTAQANPKLQGFADVMRQMLDERRLSIQALGTGKLATFIQDYFPHIWKDPIKARNKFVEAFAKQPLQGSKNFLKRRSIPLTQDGIAMGLEPVSKNPVDLMLLKLREMDKYLMAHRVLQEMKSQSLVQYVKANHKIPDGWVKINDNVFTVYGGPSAKPQGGTLIRGHYVAPEAAAKVINNYLSPGIRGTWAKVPFEVWRGTSNMLNQFQLGWSAFHAGFTTLDVAVSRTAAGLEDIFTYRKPLRGLQTLASTPVSPLTNLLKGNRMLKEWYDPGSQGAEYGRLVEAMVNAGGRARMDRFYATEMTKKFTDVLREGNILGAAVRSPAALTDLLSKPVMEWLVPRQKMGIFTEMARREIERLGPTASQAQIRDAMAKAWDSVDNRMGQLVYDNLFWHKTTKDLAMASVRSVGWNLGTIREVAGGAKDYATLPIRATKKVFGGHKDPLFTHKMAYTTALPVVVGMIGAITQYLMSGERPKELKDYFFPRTGNTDENGSPERLSLPSYMKDLYPIIATARTRPSKLPSTLGTMAAHKAHPMISLVAEMLNNEDYYGVKIRNEDDPTVQQLKDSALHVLKSFQPFAFRGLQKERERGTGKKGQMLPFIGVTPAPAYVNKSLAETVLDEKLKEQMPDAPRTKAEAERSKLRHQLQKRIRQGQDVGGEINAGIAAGTLRPDDADAIPRDAKKSAPALRFARLRLKDAIDVYQVMTESERAAVREVLEKKAESVDDLPKDEAEQLKKRMQAIGLHPSFKLRPREPKTMEKAKKAKGAGWSF